MEEEKREILTSNVEMTEIDQSIYKNFDFDFDGTTPLASAIEDDEGEDSEALH